ASASKRLGEDLPRIDAMARARAWKVKEHGALLKAARTLERAYDAAIPFLTRLDEVGRALATTARLVSVDKELLVWAAGARWLYRNGNFAAARLVEGEYAALSRRLSDGASADVLGVLGDLQTALAALPAARVILGKRRWEA